MADASPAVPPPSPDLPTALEAVLFAHGEPVEAQTLAGWLGVSPDALPDVVKALGERLADSPFAVRSVAGGYQLVLKPLWSQWLQALEPQRVESLSPAAWECLAVVAYRQPVTRLEIEAIRQVGSEAALELLERRGLIQAVGRKRAPGRPILYGTTPRFLEVFGLQSLEDLPPLPDAAASS
jgi:segregation and condensation protein B